MVLYNPSSRQLQIVPKKMTTSQTALILPPKRTPSTRIAKRKKAIPQNHHSSLDICPLCKRPFEHFTQVDASYFEMLARLTDTVHPSTNMIEMHSLHGFNQGYYKRFFVEEKLLGRGGNGAVHLCWHELEGHRLGRFAVKIVPVGDSEEWLSKRLQEVRTMCRLKHPNIIEYKHAWMEEWSSSPFAPRIPCLFILMEYADAGSLESCLDEKSEEVERLFEQATKGLAYLHHQRILHRDIKPSNVLLSLEESGELRAILSDFGESKEDICVSTGATGTLEYVAPEVLKESPFTEKSDIWSLGMLLYYMIHQRLPYSCSTPDQLANEICNVSDIKPFKGSQRFKRIMQSTLKVNPNERADIDTVVAMFYSQKEHGIANWRQVSLRLSMLAVCGFVLVYFDGNIIAVLMSLIVIFYLNDRIN